MRRFENDRFLGGGNRESHCLFMLMRRGGFIKSKNWGMTMDFFHDTLENGHRDMRKTNRHKEKWIVLSMMK